MTAAQEKGKSNDFINVHKKKRSLKQLSLFGYLTVVMPNNTWKLHHEPHDAAAVGGDGEKCRRKNSWTWKGHNPVDLKFSCMPQTFLMVYLMICYQFKSAENEIFDNLCLSQNLTVGTRWHRCIYIHRYICNVDNHTSTTDGSTPGHLAVSHLLPTLLLTLLSVAPSSFEALTKAKELGELSVFA